MFEASSVLIIRNEISALYKFVVYHQDKRKRSERSERSVCPLSFNSTAQTDAFAVAPTSAQNSAPYVHEKSILAPVMSAEFQFSPPGGAF
jgi:hypothetical protein